MIKIQGNIPRDVGVAVSGGVDSMAVLDFLARNHKVTAYCFDHRTDHGAKALDFVEKFCTLRGILLQKGMIQNERPRGISREEHWRNERYAWLKSFDRTIVLGHHLDDCVETYIFNMCHGNNWIIPYRHANCIRPFRLNTKKTLTQWAEHHRVPVLEDPSNTDIDFTRNYIRNRVVPDLHRVNPGLQKVIKKKLLAEDCE